MLFRLFVIVLLLLGSFLVIGLTPIEYVNGMAELLKSEKELTMKQKIEALRKKKKEKAFIGLITEVKDILDYINQRELFTRLCVIAALAALIGTVVSLSINNAFLIAPLSIGAAVAPFLYMKFRGMQMKAALNEELETAISVITTSYLRSEDIIRAVQENLGYIKMGNIKKAFEEFVVDATLINPDLLLALENLQGKIENDIFKEWVDELLACQNDRNLKNTLTPIVEKFSDVRIVTSEMEELIYAPAKQFILMCVIVIGVVPLFYFINKEWFYALMTTGAGKLVLSIVVAIIIYSVAGVIKVTKPVEYRR